MLHAIPRCAVLCGAFASDLDGLRKYSLEGAQMGFTGKQVIHPSQVPVVQEAFTPSSEKVAWATQLIQAFEEHQKSGKVLLWGIRRRSGWARDEPLRGWPFFWSTDFFGPISVIGTFRFFQGAFTFRGNMIDKPLLLQAKNIVQFVDAIKLAR